VTVKVWRPFAGLLALVIGVYLVRISIPLPGAALEGVVSDCNGPSFGWGSIWVSCPDREPRTTDLAGASLAVAVVV